MSEAKEFKVIVLDPDQDFLQEVATLCPNPSIAVIKHHYTRKTPLSVEDLLLEHYPDIVVINLDQDDMIDFGDIVSKIHSIPFATPPILVGTTLQEGLKFKELAYQNGIADYLLRPFSVQELWMHLLVHLRTRRLQKQLDMALRSLSSLNLQLAESNRRLEELSVTDELTGLFNMRYMAEYLEKTFSLIKRHNRSFSLMMIDLDHFKEVNDQNDHLVGSASIRSVGIAIEQATRKTDIKARYGGDEYIIVMPETNQDAALFVAERVLHAIATTELTGNEGAKFKITASIGVATYDSKRHQNYRDLVKDADRAMYRAKQSGRARVVTFEGPIEGYDETQSSILTAIEKAKKKRNSD